MKKSINYIAILIGGVLLGWFLFGGAFSSSETHNHKEETAAVNQKWTCSMHPQIMQPEPGDCAICGMDLIPADASADGLEANQFKMTKNAMALANIQTAIVKGNASSDGTLTLSGKIVENATATATQPAHFSGRIEKLFITSVGQSVKKGQAIAEVYAPEVVVAQQELISAYKTRKEQPELYKAVRSKFDFWKIQGKQLLEIEKTGKTKTAFTIYAHVDGIVTDILVNVGAHIMDGHAFFKVTSLQTVWAEFDMYEKQIPSIKKGTEISISTNTNLEESINAKISFIDPVLNTKTRTVIVRAELKNLKGNLKPGMFVKGNLMLDRSFSLVDQVLVPKTAVLWTGKRSLVYVKSGEESVFEMREIALGNSNGKSYEVLSGLNAGEEIVVNGTFTVDAAAQLQGKKSMMTSDNSNAEKKEIKRIIVAKEFQRQLQNLVSTYLDLKNNLVKSDSNKAQKNARSFNSNLEKINMKLLKGEAHTQWVMFSKELKSSAIKLANSSDIIVQRSAFTDLSSHLISAIKTFRINIKIYNQFCPMANNDKGANWLSLSEKIKNPYFGDSMLTCGNVEEIIN